MRNLKTVVFFFWSVLLALGLAGPSNVYSQTPTPNNLKIAFIGDQGLGDGAQKVLQLIKAEGADLVIHSGDFDYADVPLAWEKQFNDILGPDIPYIGCVGNHDVKMWAGPQGYQKLLEDRCNRLGIQWTGDLGAKSSIYYKGIHILLLAPETIGEGHAAYIKAQFKDDPSRWRICSWHKNQHLMQLGDKKDETGWDVYEAARQAGALIATGYEHSYSRTYLMSDFTHQTVADESDTLTLSKGKSFAFVSGLGGKSVRPQKLKGKWWAKVYTSDQQATYGCLFGVFNVDGKANQADFYFKNIKGETIDHFKVVSGL